MTHPSGPRRRATFALAAALGLAVVTGGRRSLAQPSPDTRAAAAALFEDGRRLMGEGKYAEACPKLEESQRMEPGMGTLYQVSACFEATGRTASAWVGFRDVADMALTAGQPDRERIARGRAAALEPKLMRLKITVQSAVASAGAVVKRDGAVVSPALWGTAVPLDPGQHKVSAVGPGKEPWQVTVQLDQPGGTVTVEVPPLLDKKPGGAVVPVVVPATPPGGAALPPPQGGSAPPPIETASPRPWQRPLGIVATVVGVAGLGAGVGVGLLAKSTFGDSNAAGGGCDATTNKCTNAGLAQRSSAVSEGNAATGAFVAGAVLAVAGVTLWITAPSSHAARSGATAPEIGLGPTGASLRVRW